MRKWISWLALFGSTATLVCCVIPVLLVSLGLGASLAGFIGVFPQIAWLSEHKALVFGTAGILIGSALLMQYRNRFVACPTDPKLAEACKSARGWSRWALYLSLILYLTSAFVAFVAPILTS